MKTCRRGGGACAAAHRPGRIDVRPRVARHSEATVAVAAPAGDRAMASNLGGRRDGEAGLDHVDAEPLELAGDLELLARGQADARRLLAVTQRGVEDPYLRCAIVLPSLDRETGGRTSPSVPVGVYAGRAAREPPRFP